MRLLQKCITTFLCLREFYAYRVDTRDNTVLHIFVAGLKKKGKRALQLVNSQSSDVTGVDTRDNVSRENKACLICIMELSLIFCFCPGSMH
jgi:hypothetical protein